MIVIKLKTKILFLCLISINLFGQKEFEKYGPFGCLTYTDLKEALKIETKVYKLDLSYKKLEPKLYEKLYKLKDLQALKLSSNEIADYPKNFDELANLVYFASYNNKLTSFPPNLQPFNNLYYLELQHTKIDSIPAQIAYLNKLQSFKFGNTDDTLSLPNTFYFLKNLKDISIENCVMDSFPKQLFKITTLNYLNLSNTNTHYITKHFERFKNLEVLIIENNPLAELPFDIYKAQNLRLISLRGNKLTKIPDSISQLENLTLLDLRGNLIEKEEIDKLKILLPGCEIKF
ncbi:MAG: leucine-rich repeat domain-containing protein [Bacteroidota bacterium]|nr:leucine-rich repeat domain-containing protein [Bacteroidota bacterium]